MRQIIIENDITIQIYHFLITNNMLDWEYPEYVKSFRDLIRTKSKKFKKKANRDYLICTIAKEPNRGVQTIAIVLPQDEFKIKIAEDIVTGRLLRALGRLKKKDGTLKKTYDKKSLPVYIFHDKDKIFKN